MSTADYISDANTNNNVPNPDVKMQNRLNVHRSLEDIRRSRIDPQKSPNVRSQFAEKGGQENYVHSAPNKFPELVVDETVMKDDDLPPGEGDPGWVDYSFERKTSQVDDPHPSKNSPAYEKKEYDGEARPQHYNRNQFYDNPSLIQSNIDDPSVIQSDIDESSLIQRNIDESSLIKKNIDDPSLIQRNIDDVMEEKNGEDLERRRPESFSPSDYIRRGGNSLYENAEIEFANRQKGFNDKFDEIVAQRSMREHNKAKNGWRAKVNYRISEKDLKSNRKNPKQMKKIHQLPVEAIRKMKAKELSRQNKFLLHGRKLLNQNNLGFPASKMGNPKGHRNVVQTNDNYNYKKLLDDYHLENFSAPVDEVVSKKFSQQKGMDINSFDKRIKLLFSSSIK